MSEDKGLIVIEHDSGQIDISPQIVRDYICPAASDKEIYVFLQLCKAQKLNPFLREAYLVKYGSSPATIITGKETFTKRAQKNPRCDGWEVTSEGVPPEMTATAKVYVKGYRMPITCTVDYAEYFAKDASGAPNKMWRDKPKTMLKKVALVQALREAFPEDLGGLYDATEISSIKTELPEDVIEVGVSPTVKEKEDAEIDKNLEDKAALQEAEFALAKQVEEILHHIDKEIDNEHHLNNYVKKLTAKGGEFEKFDKSIQVQIKAAVALKRGELNKPEEREPGQEG